MSVNASALFGHRLDDCVQQARRIYDSRYHTEWIDLSDETQFARNTMKAIYGEEPTNEQIAELFGVPVGYLPPKFGCTTIPERDLDDIGRPAPYTVSHQMICFTDRFLAESFVRDRKLSSGGFSITIPDGVFAERRGALVKLVGSATSDPYY